MKEEEKRKKKRISLCSPPSPRLVSISNLTPPPFPQSNNENALGTEDVAEVKEKPHRVMIWKEKKKEGKDDSDLWSS